MADFVKLGPASDVPPGKMKQYVVDGLPVAVYNCAGKLTATADTCSHAEASLAGGYLDCDSGQVECPLHGARFDIFTGKALSMPAVTPVKVFPLKVEGGDLFVAI